MSSSVLDATQTSPTIAASGAAKQQRTLRDGAAIDVDWLQSLVIEGICHGAQTGTGTAPDTFNPIYGDALQDFYLFIPAGTKIIPLQVSVCFEDTGTVLAIDTLAGYSTNGDSNPTGDALTIYNYHTLASPASACTATAVVTSTGSTHLAGTDFLEFWRPYAGFGDDAFGSSTAFTGGGQYAVAGAHYSARDFIAPVIGDADTDCALSVFAGSQAGLGYITVIWAEFPAARLE